MKKFTILFLSLSISLFSCSNDSDNNISADIVGTWIGVDVNYTGSTTTKFQGENVTANFIGEAYDVDYTLTFLENPNTFVSDGSYNIELTTTIDGQTQVDNSENLEFLSGGSWIKVGNQLSVVEDGETIILTIKELTETSMTLTAVEVEEIIDQGIAFSSTVNIVVTYIRQ
ncbi:hypothetical protein SAMN05428642_10427 [Flaviramulus basaltis]|uniref:Lipocalin-like domain-containing protein n=1 Tax=Flaviramulus basaltis TaxID=369401 RepID=A0A1K2IP81_9FLAO|nr:hypothetical protein [Flaviramulus basaltis]SFZ94253.1 hypothetical protein SAMN05428642_10427 [Flaviramulus basaltis]